MSRCFATNAPAVVSEVIDGEAVIMNLQSGHYFSARDTGALVWSWLERGATEDEVATALAARCRVTVPEVRLAVASFVSTLLTHQLVHEVAPGSAPAGVRDLSGGPMDWTTPQLHVYTDMEELLLLDPIHDVGEAGWPMPKPPEDQAA